MTESTKTKAIARRVLQYIRENPEIRSNDEELTCKIAEILRDLNWKHYFPKDIEEYFERYIYDVFHTNRRLSLQLEELDKKLSRTINIEPFHCPLNGGGSSTSPTELIVAGGSSNSAIEKGRKQSDTILKKWLENSSKVHIIDPYIFKRSHSKKETKDESLVLDRKYIEDLLDVIGRDKEVDFIYKSKISGDTKISPTIANIVETSISKQNLKAKFWVAPDLHDRIWISEDSKGNTSAKVLGTSRDGIGKRPTYILDMPPEDIREYWKYVKHLKEISQKNNSRPTHYKPENTKKTENS
ncbi:hypothetical protein ACQ4OB_15240 [Pseudomonas sp. ES4]|uniref:hypothetical protein n=1 Tax=Pseudomonas sp. ES4 TaxID=3424777 RepID=UPI003D32AC7C